MNEYCKSLVGVTRDLHLDNRFSILRCRDGRIACLIFVSRWEGLRTQGIAPSLQGQTDMENGRFDANLSLFAGLFVELGDHVLFSHSKSSFDHFLLCILGCVSRVRVSHEANLNA